jgi:hypothetical protein
MVLAVLLPLVGACAGGAVGPAASSPADPSPTTATSPSAAPAPTRTVRPPTPSRTVAPTPATVPTRFTSTTYGYSLTVPPGWTTVQATVAWDGTSAVSHDGPESDQFIHSYPRSAWANATSTSDPLSDVVNQVISDTAKYHGDTCPAAPEARHSIKIGGEPATLLEWNCGILINSAITVHEGVAYLFGFRDLGVHAAADPTDRKALQGLLDSVRFP